MTDEELFKKLKPHKEVMESLRRGFSEFEEGRKQFYEGYGFGDSPSPSGYLRRVFKEDAERRLAEWETWWRTGQEGPCPL